MAMSFKTKSIINDYSPYKHLSRTCQTLGSCFVNIFFVIIPFYFSFFRLHSFVVRCVALKVSFYKTNRLFNICCCCSCGFILVTLFSMSVLCTRHRDMKREIDYIHSKKSSFEYFFNWSMPFKSFVWPNKRKLSV